VYECVFRVCVCGNTELVPHFEQSDAAYATYPPISDAYEQFDLEISFKPEATDGQKTFVSVFNSAWPSLRG